MKWQKRLGRQTGDSDGWPYIKWDVTNLEGFDEFYVQWNCKKKRVSLTANLMNCGKYNILVCWEDRRVSGKNITYIKHRLDRPAQYFGVWSREFLFHAIRYMDNPGAMDNYAWRKCTWYCGGIAFGFPRRRVTLKHLAQEIQDYPDDVEAIIAIGRGIGLLDDKREKALRLLAL